MVLKGSQTVVEALNNCAKPPYLPAYFTLFEAKGHNGWDQVYDRTSGYDIYEWMLALKKNVSMNYKPLLNLGPDRTFLIPKHPLRFHSFAYDPNGTITKYVWQKISGPAVSFTNGKSFTQMKPTVAGTYVFRLTVTDNEGNTKNDDIQIRILSATSEPEVVTLRLYDGKNKKDLGPIVFKQIVNLNTYNAELLDIIATTKNLKALSNSVRFEIDHNRNFNTMNDKELTASYPSYTIGRQNHKFFVPFVDEYTVTATAYHDRLSANPGISYQVTFSCTKPLQATNEANHESSGLDSETNPRRLYPNPASHVVNVETKGFAGPVSWTIMSSAGEVVGKGTFSNETLINTLSLEGITPGAYILKLSDESRSVNKKLLIR